MRQLTTDRDKCTDCLECMGVCLKKAFERIENLPSYVRTDRCTECDFCMNICPGDAVSIVNSTA